MKRLLVKQIACFGISFACASAIAYSPQRLDQILGWVSQKNQYNLCGGYYQELPIPYTPNPLTQSQANNYDIKADKSHFSLNGTSNLIGHVRVSQPNQELKANKAYFYRNSAGKISHINLHGNVQYNTPGQMLHGERGEANLTSNDVKIYNGVFRVSLANKDTSTHNLPGKLYALNFWGTAKTLEQKKQGYYVIKQAKYTTCSPSCHTWDLHSSTVTIDKPHNKGSAWNSVLYWKHVPIFYLPYVSFPLKHIRKTGFLSPQYSHTSTSGFGIGFPFYWNMAPNYDALLTTSYLQERGIQETGILRYLGRNTDSRFNFSFLPSDRKFRQFKKDQAASPSANRPSALRDLENDSNNRYALHFNNNVYYNQNWQSHIDVTQDSDDYYAEDFNSVNYNDGTPNELLQQADLEYQNTNWDVQGLVQGYQILHPINQSVVQNQYQRLPQLTANGNYTNVWRDLELGVNSQLTNFYEPNQPDPTSGNGIPVNGGRFTIDPYISYPLMSAYGFLTPKLQMRMTQYTLNQLGSLRKRNPSLNVPIVSIDSGLTFLRDFNWLNKAYEQTLEPELYYLYVPYRNQSDIPLFDTDAQVFSYQSLFEDNRFSGIDRIGDANQLSYALTSRFIDVDSGLSRATISLGQIHYFQNRKVTLNNTPPTSDDKHAYSPLVSQGTFSFNQAWSANAGLTWSPYSKKFTDRSVGLTFSPDPAHLVQGSYSFVNNQEMTDGETGLKSFALSSYWRVKRHVDLIGAWNHQWDTTSSTTTATPVANTYLFGMGYQSCCWGIRVLYLKQFNGVAASGKFKYNNQVYVQFVLNGLGDYNTQGVDDVLKQYISGYNATFAGMK